MSCPKVVLTKIQNKEQQQHLETKAAHFLAFLVSEQLPKLNCLNSDILLDNYGLQHKLHNDIVSV